MQTTMEPTITEAQIRKIWFESKQLGMSYEDLHSFVEALTCETSIKSLTKAEGIVVIDELVRLSSSGNVRPGMITSRQAWKIEELRKSLEWEPERLKNFVKKYGHVENVRWLSEYKASSIITGLSNALKRQRAKKTKESEEAVMKSAEKANTQGEISAKQDYTLKVSDPAKLKELFKDRYCNYVDDKGNPTEALVNLLSNGDDIIQNKIRGAVDIEMAM